MALDYSELSPRELAVRFTDERRYFVSEATVYRLLKAHDLITECLEVSNEVTFFHRSCSSSGENWSRKNTPCDCSQRQPVTAAMLGHGATVGVHQDAVLIAQAPRSQFAGWLL